jgi:alkylation response protein AidB-like acyl-CoA dehydrogenase
MDFSFTPEQERLRLEVRKFLQKEVTDESRLDFRFDRPYSQDTWRLLRKLGERAKNKVIEILKTEKVVPLKKLLEQ